MFSLRISGSSLCDSPLSEILLPKLLLDVRTERNQTFVLFAVLRVVAAQGNELFANRTSPVGLPLAVLRVRDDALHLLARRQTTIGIATLASVNERLDAALDGLLASFLRIGLRTSVGWRRAVVEIEAETLHVMLVADFVFAGETQIEILRRKKG